MTHIGKNIEKFLSTKNLSGKEMEKIFGVTKANVYASLKKDDLSTKYIQALVDHFGVDPAIFFGWKKREAQEVKNPDIKKAIMLLEEAQKLLYKTAGK